MLDLTTIIARLEAQASAIAALATASDAAQARWKPAPDEWSLLEVINHLADEEREDFRLRLDLTLHQPERPLPPIDPQGWVTARSYNTRDPAESLGRWLAERRESLAWLRGLQSPDWSRHLNHQQLGDMTAGDLLASWAAHDLLHLRQLVELHYRYLAQQAAPSSVEYAGEW